MDDIAERLRAIAPDGRTATHSSICEHAADEIERLRAELADAIKAIDRLHDERRELMTECKELTDVLLRNGFRRCDIPACNCGSWHHVGGFAERFREIDEVTGTEYRNGEILLSRIKRLMAECEALRKDAELVAGKTALRCIEMAMWPQGLDDEQAYYGRMFAEFIRNEFKGAIDRAMASSAEGGSHDAA